MKPVSKCPLTDYTDLWDKANLAGKQAVATLNVRPLIVKEASNIFRNSFDQNDRLPSADKPVVVNQDGTTSWYVEEGDCGYAWIQIRPSSETGLRDCDFVKWLRAKDIGSYWGNFKAWTISVDDYNQSMQKKKAFADAVVEILKGAGIEASSVSGMT